jgi:hypothetical protein
VKVQGSRFMVQGSWFKVQGSRFKVQGSRFKVQGSGFKVQVVTLVIGHAQRRQGYVLEDRFEVQEFRV